MMMMITAIGLSPGGSSYFTCIQNMKLVTNKWGQQTPPKRWYLPT